MDVKLNHRYKADAQQSYTLPSSYYTNEAIFNMEKEKVFCKNWIFAGHIEKVSEPGEYFTFQIFDQNIMIIKGADKTIRGFYNVCPHRGHELVEGEGKKSIISCPYHAWTFHLDGQFNRGRAVDQIQNFDNNEACLTAVRVEVFLNFIFVNLDPNAKSLREMMPGLEGEIRANIPKLDQLTLSHRIKYDIKANWKNVVDNYLECNHCQVAHPQFVELVDMKSYKINADEYYISQTSKGKQTLNCNVNNETSNEDVETYLSYWLWPTLAIDIMPGETGLIIMYIEPDGPENTIEHLEFYYLTKEPSAEGWANIEYQDKVLTPEDIALVESVQRGLHSKGYVDGRYVVDNGHTSISEHGVHHFHGLVLKALEGFKKNE
ncbi:aromatic ring-hydroxylating oxygenase subunit alpha [Pseudalkalibacillus decolorationis]|uniref:aromatic ring-hydroxylating oxygenase subunit alpha n=1 Tax=Pseudalkalibacillus decolorationis TaxID=163879 RepID=UPI002148D29F|nr:aromatic ring-hydroxylating dioxygenase subunit alpha [Pseudalkalibacillus decolorationis]